MRYPIMKMKCHHSHPYTHININAQIKNIKDTQVGNRKQQNVKYVHK